jgi:tetratricopeptide (TPR) repeat protein
MAVLGEAQALLGTGDYAGATKLYQRFVDAPEGAEPFLFLAYEGLGIALEGQGKLDDAMKQYQALEAVGDGRYKSLSLYHQARILEAQGKKDEASQAYKRLASQIGEAPKMTPMLGYLQERIAGKEGVPAMPAAGGGPGVLMGPDGQMIPTPGAGDLGPEELERLKQALEKLEQERKLEEEAPPAGKEAPPPLEGGEPAPEGEKAQ